MLTGIPPQLSVSKAMQYLKEKSSHKLLRSLPLSPSNRNSHPRTSMFSAFRSHGLAQSHCAFSRPLYCRTASPSALDPIL